MPDNRLPAPSVIVRTNDRSAAARGPLGAARAAARAAGDVALSLRVKLARRAFDSRVGAPVARRRHVLCIGDSHVPPFEHVRLPCVWLRTFVVEGATASGI